MNSNFDLNENKVFEREQKSKEQLKELEKKVADRNKQEIQKRLDERKKQEEALKEENNKETSSHTPGTYKKIGSGVDLPIDTNEAFNNYDREAYTKYSEDKNDKKNKAGAEKDETFESSNTEEHETSTSSTQEGSSKQNDDERQAIYNHYKEGVMNAPNSSRIIRLVARHSGAMQTDLVKGAITAKLIIDASGIPIFTKKHNLKSVSESLSEEEVASLNAATNHLAQKGLLNKNTTSMEYVRPLIDKEFYEMTGLNISTLSSKKISSLIKSGDINSLVGPEKIAQTTTLAKASLITHKHAELSGKVKMAKVGQRQATIILVDRLMGNDIDLWNGVKKGRQIRRTYKMLRRTSKKIMRSFAEAKATIANKFTKRTARTAATSSAKASGASKAVTKGVIGSVKTSSGATKALASVGKTTSTAGATVSRGAAAGSKAVKTSAKAASSNPFVAIAAAVIVIVLVVIIMIFASAIGSASGISFGSVNIYGEEIEDDPYNTALYKGYETLIKHDEELVTILQDLQIADYIVLFRDDLPSLSDYNVANYNYALAGHGQVTSQIKRDSEGKSVIKYFDTNGKQLANYNSNAKDILCAAVAVCGNEPIPYTFLHYAENLWYDSHSVKAVFETDTKGNILISPCEFASCCGEYQVITERTTLANGTVLSEKSYITKVNNPNFKILLSDNFREDLLSRISEKYLFCYQSKDSETWTIFDGTFKENYYYRFCAGHAYIHFEITTNYITDNLEDTTKQSLFSIDSFTHDPQNADFWNGKRQGFMKSFSPLGDSLTAYTRLTLNTIWDGEHFITYNDTTSETSETEYILWAGWDDDQIDLAMKYYEEDWYKEYGISFALSSSSGLPLEEELHGEILGSIEISNTMIPEIVDFALATVGRIPYYWGGKQNITTAYISIKEDIAMAEFLSTYYPHLGTQIVTVQNNNPVSVDGWYGCGGVDSKRHIIGLDCSGWISFVYNNFGVSVGAGTNGLSKSGYAVSFDDLVAGDLMIDDSYNAHVVMFLYWDNEEHTSYTTVECAGSSGVVARSGVTKKWEHYRRILQ